jgi:hypothetical protein
MQSMSTPTLRDLAPAPVIAINPDQVKGGFLGGNPDRPLIAGRAAPR